MSKLKTWNDLKKVCNNLNEDQLKQEINVLEKHLTLSDKDMIVILTDVKEDKGEIYFEAEIESV